MEASTSNILQYQTIPNESETGELFEFEALLEIRERDGQRGIASRPNNFRSTSNTTRRLSPSAITINNNNDGSYIDIEQQGFFVCPLERNCFKASLAWFERSTMIPFFFRCGAIVINLYWLCWNRLQDLGICGSKIALECCWHPAETCVNQTCNVTIRFMYFSNWF